MTIAAVLAVSASTHDATATVTVRHGLSATSPVRGIDDVVQVASGAPPPATRGARCRDDGHGQIGVVQGALVVVPDAEVPAPVRGRARGADVAAEADQHPAAGLFGGVHGDPVGGQRLRSGPEVEFDTAGQQYLAAGRVPPHPPPARRGMWWRHRHGNIHGHCREVTGAAERAYRVPDCGVDHTVGELRRSQCHGQRLGQQRAHRHCGPGPLVQPGDLGVDPKPAAGGVHRGQLA
jgi:hypothetical protein